MTLGALSEKLRKRVTELRHDNRMHWKGQNGMILLIYIAALHSKWENVIGLEIKNNQLSLSLPILPLLPANNTVLVDGETAITL